MAPPPQRGLARAPPWRSRRRANATSRSANPSCSSRSRKDAALLDAQSDRVGPFARLDAGAVAARDGKTRGSITNLFGSQAAFQAETMALALSAGAWIETINTPPPPDFSTPMRGSTPSSPANRRAARVTARNRR